MHVNVCRNYPPPPSSIPVITYQLSSYLALNQVPTSGQLSHVNELSETSRQQTGYRAGTITPITMHSLYIGGGLPPIPQKLIRRIQDGHFINMAELLPDNLEATNSTDDDHTTNTKRKHQEVTQMMDWIQCFSTYVAVVSRAKPDRVVDLIAYLNLIINGQRRFQDFDWASYDRQFRQKAAATSALQWGTTEGTLWNLSCCNRYTRSSTTFSSTTSTKKVPICLEWNEDPSEGCPHLNFRYEHVCYRCINVPAITDNRHKAIHCPNKERRSTNNEGRSTKPARR